MASLTGETIASTYDLLVKRHETYVQAGTNIELMTDSSGATAATGLYLESGATTSNVGIGVADPDSILEVKGSTPVLHITSTSGDAKIQLEAAAGTNQSMLEFYDGTDRAGYIEYDFVGTTGDLMKFNVNDDNRMVINGAGNVGIGIASPDAALDVTQATTDKFAGIFYNTDSADSYGVYIAAGNDANDKALYVQNRAKNNEILTCLGDGNVGIGIAAPLHPLDVYDNADNSWVARFGQDHATGYGVLIDTDGTNSGDNAFWVSDDGGSSSLFAVQGNGNVGINESAPSYKLDITGVNDTTNIARISMGAAATDNRGAYFLATCTPASGNAASAEIGSVLNASSVSDDPCAYIRMDTGDNVSNYLWVDDSDILRISTDGNHIGTANGTVVGAQSSDEKLKNISTKAFPYGLDEINKLTPIKYSMKVDKDAKQKLGFGAQTTKPIIPEVVIDTKECADGVETIDGFDGDGNPTREHISKKGNNKDTWLSMEYVGIIPVLVKAVQELSAKVTALENA